MKVSKLRLETISDGVIAIILTIMVLSIPLPPAFDWASISNLLGSFFIYFISFVVVGAFWAQHNRAFTYMEEVNNQVLATNLLFLFFLSLLPILTKWVMENPGELMPVLGYDIVYFLVSLTYMLIFRYVVNTSQAEEIARLRETHEQQSRAAAPKTSWWRIVLIPLVIIGAVLLSFIVPQMTTVFLLGLPVVFSVINILFDTDKTRSEREGERI